MTPRQRPSTLILYFILLWCVFSFKFLLGAVGEAGYRTDDLLIALGFMILLLRGDIARIPRSRVLLTYLMFMFICFVSTVWNALLGRLPLGYSLIFDTRLLEYLIFYYLGYVLLESGIVVWRGIKMYFYFLCILVPLQLMNLIPTVSKFQVSRAIGNTNGPYELAVVASFFLCYFLYQERRILNTFLSVVMLLLTASRITFVGAIISTVGRLGYRGRAFNKALAVAVMLLATVVIWKGQELISPDSSVANSDNTSQSMIDRLNSSSTLFSFDYINTLYTAVPAYSNSRDYGVGAFAMASNFSSQRREDVSGMVRAYRWMSLIKSTVANSDSIVIGLGPSFGSAAVDGYFTRVIIESGLLGMLFFIVFLSSLIKQKGGESGAFREYITIMIVSAIFIDIFTAYKPMLLMWLWHGMNEYEARQTEECV